MATTNHQVEGASLLEGYFSAARFKLMSKEFSPLNQEGLLFIRQVER